MDARITRHQADRPAGWRVIEAPRRAAAALEATAAPDRCVVVDCLTLWLAKRSMAPKPRPREGAERLPMFARERAAARPDPRLPGRVIFVANEVGLGLVPETPLGRLFRDEAGRANQAVAAPCERVVVFVAAGLPLVSGHARPMTPPISHSPSPPSHFPPPARPASIRRFRPPAAVATAYAIARPDQGIAAALQQRIDARPTPPPRTARPLAKRSGSSSRTCSPELRQPDAGVSATTARPRPPCVGLPAGRDLADGRELPGWRRGDQCLRPPDEPGPDGGCRRGPCFPRPSPASSTPSSAPAPPTT